jgi:arylsulfatase A-like enzyme
MTMARRGWRRPALVAGAAVLLALAGVHLYNFVRLDGSALHADVQPVLERARDISARARPEYQELALARLPANPLNAPYYRLDDLLHDAKVVDGPPKVADANGTIIEAFEFESPDRPSLVAADGGAVPRLENGVLEVVGHNARDLLTNHAVLAVPRDDVGDVVVRARASEEAWMTLAWSKDDAPVDVWWRHSLQIHLLGDQEFHNYVINGQNMLKRGLRPGESLARLYLQPSSVSGADVDIDFIRFLSKRSRYLAAPNGTQYETLGGELRKILYMLPEQTLEWTIDVPPDAWLEFGNGVLLDRHPVRFEVSLAADDRTVVLHDHTVGGADGWHDSRLDLSSWAGKSVRLRLKVSGDAGNVAFWSSPIVHSRPKQRFNVIVLLEDALRADHLSSYGYERDTSPNKTALMRERGIQFDWAVSQATKTRPSVPSLMTSLYPTATGVWHFSDMLSDRYLTLAEVMRAQGFTTASFIENGNAGPYAGLHQGFSELQDDLGGASEEIFGNRVSDWLGQHKDQNFFLYLHAIDPHGPYAPPPPYDAWYREVAGQGNPVPHDTELEPETIGNPTDEGRRARYAGEIRHNDALLPGLLKRLDELGLTEDTLLIMLADHGEYLGEHGLWSHNPPGRMSVIHVPLMMTYPKRFKQPERIDDVVQLLDVMPTILELAGVDRSDLLLQGDSLVGLIDGKDADRWRNRVVISEEPMAMHRQNPCACGSIIRQDLHLINSVSFWPARGQRYAPDLFAFVKTRVYDFRDDPDELSALPSFAPDLHARWLALDVFSDLHASNIETERKLTEGAGRDLQLDPDTLEHLKGLGYVN